MSYAHAVIVVSLIIIKGLIILLSQKIVDLISLISLQWQQLHQYLIIILLNLNEKKVCIG